MWASGLCHSIEQQSNQSPKPLDLKFLEDLLLSDIQTALSRLQDTLRRVDVGTLTKYNSTLDSTNKLHLLRLISNLLSRLKVPEELSVEPSEKASKPAQGTGGKRRRANRHTIGVSAEEIAHARRLLDEKNIGNEVLPSPLSPCTAQAKPVIEAQVQPPVEKPAEETFVRKSGAQQVPPPPPPKLKTFEQVREKHIKDAINQQQTAYYNKNKDFYKENVYCQHSSSPPPEIGSTEGNVVLLENVIKRAEMPRKEEREFQPAEDEEYSNHQVPAFYQQPVASKYNKFVAKKSKIKRANTIDIPSYLKLQAENFGQNQSAALRRPIDIGDKSLGSNANIIPAFKPKTDNDRKFLALINKNNDTAPSNSKLPFKSFNYRQPDNVDKNWNNRFSNIKTTFDKPASQLVSPATDENSRVTGNSESSSRRSFSGTSDSGESDEVVVGTLRLPYTTQPKPKQSGFTHAPTSPFQRIEKPANRSENASIFKSGYLPKGGSNSLQAKVKIFNQENGGQTLAAPISIVAQNKNKFNKMNDLQSRYETAERKVAKNLNPQHGSATISDPLNLSQSRSDNTVRSYLPGNRNVISSKLIVNANVNGDEQAAVKHQYPYIGYPGNTTKITKADKVPRNEERTEYYGQLQNVNSYPPKKIEEAEPPVRTSSHSFMMQKIANEHNNYENKPKVNQRYVNEALRLKENKEEKPGHIHTPLKSHYIKAAGTRENYNNSSNIAPLQNHHPRVQIVKRQPPVQTFNNLNSNQNSNKRLSQDYSSPEYKPQQVIYPQPLNEAVTRLNSIPVQSNMASKTQENSIVYEDSMTRNLASRANAVSNQLSEANNKPASSIIEPNYPSHPHGFYRPSNTYNVQYSAQPRRDTTTHRQPGDYTNQSNSVKIAKLPEEHTHADDPRGLSGSYETNTSRTMAKSQQDNEHLQANKLPTRNNTSINYKDSDYIPYQSYKTRKEFGSNMDANLRNSYPETKHYYNHDHAHNPTQNERTHNDQMVSSSSSSLGENNPDKEIQMYVTEPETPDVASIEVFRDQRMLLEDENIQNQDISSEGIVTRYQCAIATVATTPESSEPDLSEVPFPNPKLYNMEVSAYPSSTNDHMSVSYGGYNDRKKPSVEVNDESADAFDEIQRHNYLQQQIINKLQNDADNSNNKNQDYPRRKSLEKFKWDDKKSSEVDETVNRRSSYYEKINPLSHFPFGKSQPSPPAAVVVKQHEEPVIESNNTLEKINMFEEKSLLPLSSTARQRFRPLSIPKFEKPKDFPPPKINVVTPSKVVQQLKSDNKDSGIISSSTNMIDSSDEYLMSCANRQSRSIVLSKSESWHQLALSRGNLQPPQPGAPNPLLKPPKSKSPASLRLSKQYEAPLASDNMKRMEEKIQRYFNSPTNVPSSESSNNNSRRESKSKRHFSSSKKNHSSTGGGVGVGLARSQTMPHLYENDKLLLDENTDVEKAFDSLFKEATRTDNRH
ncbi:uncharacterized protein LOC124297469 [Neodiprion virginianus]|uniref:uncharacterized protein LOC124297469 n=1 Tax=Neodiprion virginianus TaxID=2961670 RepID=UPI001EE72307|nr:uncharacterized protein LOC124297469 [Neodiprion virginianus]